MAVSSAARAPSSPGAPGSARASSWDGARTRRYQWSGWGFVGPFLAVFAFALVAPIGYAIYLSLYRHQLIGGTVFVGLANYHQALTDPQFWESLRHVGIFLVFQVPIMLVLALVAALALDSARLRWAPLYRLAIFLPYAVPAVVAALMWGFMYGSQFGLVADLSNFFRVHLPDPLSSSWVLASIGNIVTWEFTGYNMLIFFSALRSVPADLYEAAEIDGASALEIVWWIKLPALRPAIVVAGIFSVIGSLQLFNEPNILQQLAPDTISTNFTPNMYAYNLSFAGQEYNYSAAIAIVMGIITMIIAYAVQLSGRRRAA
jgi:multiple sugar transport system permease protein